MQSNTVETGNRAVDFPNFPVQKEGYRWDPITVREGHYIGHDGFVVPKDFAEFYKRFPHDVQRWVSKYAGMPASSEARQICGPSSPLATVHLP